jgi:hypothetical protein
MTEFLVCAIEPLSRPYWRETMLRSLALVLFMIAVVPAHAGCWDTEGKYPDPDEPKVVICYKGTCSESTPVYGCSNATSARFGYSDGWEFYLSEDQNSAISSDGEELLDLSNVRCYDEEGENLCPPLRGR